MAAKKTPAEVPAETEKAAPKKTALKSSDPKWPPIGARYQSLVECDGVIPWAQEIDKKVKTTAEAIEAIMRDEYGDKAYEAWAGQ
jgi:hypothetical protein